MDNEWKLEEILDFYDSIGLDSKTFVSIYEKIEQEITDYMMKQLETGNISCDVHKERMRKWDLYLRKYKIEKLRV